MFNANFNAFLLLLARKLSKELAFFLIECAFFRVNKKKVVEHQGNFDALNWMQTIWMTFYSTF